MAKAELLWLREYNKDSSLNEVLRVSLPFQLTETVTNDSKLFVSVPRAHGLVKSKNEKTAFIRVPIFYLLFARGRRIRGIREFRKAKPVSQSLGVLRSPASRESCLPAGTAQVISALPLTPSRSRASREMEFDLICQEWHV